MRWSIASIVAVTAWVAIAAWAVGRLFHLLARRWAGMPQDSRTPVYVAGYIMLATLFGGATIVLVLNGPVWPKSEMVNRMIVLAMILSELNYFRAWIKFRRRRA